MGVIWTFVQHFLGLWVFLGSHFRKMAALLSSSSSSLVSSTFLVLFIVNSSFYILFCYFFFSLSFFKGFLFPIISSFLANFLFSPFNLFPFPEVLLSVPFPFSHAVTPSAFLSLYSLLFLFLHFIIQFLLFLSLSFFLLLLSPSPPLLGPLLRTLFLSSFSSNQFSKVPQPHAVTGYC